jgi:hypothetical protein
MQTMHTSGWERGRAPPTWRLERIVERLVYKSRLDDTLVQDDSSQKMSSNTSTRGIIIRFIPPLCGIIIWQSTPLVDLDKAQMVAGSTEIASLEVPREGKTIPLQATFLR